MSIINVTDFDNQTTLSPTRPVFHHSVVFAGGDYCYDLSFRTKRWCPYGCCGSMENNCCNANIALIVGLTVLCLLVALSVFICLVCCLRRRKGVSGRVIDAHPTPLAHVMSGASSHATVTSIGQPLHAYGMPGPLLTYSTQIYQPDYHTSQNVMPQPPPYTECQPAPPQYSSSPFKSPN